MKGNYPRQFFSHEDVVKKCGKLLIYLKLIPNDRI